MRLTDEQQRWLTRAQAEWNDLMRPGAHLFEPSASLPDSAVAAAKLVASRSAALDLLPRGGTIAELGTQAGRYARQILDVSAPRSLHLFDLEFETLRGRDPTVADDPRVELHLGDSSTNLAGFPDGSFDWIYIDGDHSEGGVRRDAECASRKISSDGLLVFNDYTLWSPLELTDYGIVPVVNEMLAGGGWEVAYLALHPLLYCDIAIRRRTGPAQAEACSPAAGAGPD